MENFHERRFGSEIVFFWRPNPVEKNHESDPRLALMKFDGIMV